jgi:hypothetical protein
MEPVEELHLATSSKPNHNALDKVLQEVAKKKASRNAKAGAVCQ